MPFFADDPNYVLPKQGILDTDWSGKTPEQKQKLFDRLERLGLVAPRKDGILTELAEGAEGAAYGVGKGLGSTLEEATGYSGMKQYFGDVMRRNQQLNPYPGYKALSLNPTDIARTIGSGAAQSTLSLAGGVAATALSGGNPVAGVIAGTATMFGQVYGDRVQEYREAFPDEDESVVKGYAFLSSLGESFIETLLGPEQLATGIAKKWATGALKETTNSLLKTVGNEAVKNFITEGSEEVAQDFWDRICRSALEEEGLQLPSWEEVGETFMGGAWSGLALGAAGGAFENVASRGKNLDRVPISEIPDKPGGTPGADTSDKGGVVTPDPTKDKTLPASVRLAAAVGKQLGIDVHFFDEPGAPSQTVNENGDRADAWYDEATNQIWLDRVAPENSIMALLGHEFKHYLDKNHGSLVEHFNELVQSGLNEAGREAVAAAEKKYEEAGQGKGNGLVEIGADEFGRMWQDPDFWQDVAARAEKMEAGLGQKFMDALQEFLTMIRKELKKIGTPEAKQLFDNLGELREEAVKITAEIKRQAGTSTEEENVVGVNGSTTVESVPVSEINLDPERFQFKSNTNKKTGVDESNLIGGEWDPKSAGILYLWEDKDGNKFVVNGHHRLELAKRKGVENLNAIIDREADGVKAEDARENGILINIRDEQGEVRDYADFVRSSKIDEATAEKEGILSRKKGKAGFNIGHYASDNLYATYRNGDVTDAQAAAIADIARGDTGLENAGIRAAKNGMKKVQLVEHLKFLKANGDLRQKNEETGDLFGGFDDSALKLSEELSAKALEHIDGLKKLINSAKSAIKNPAEAKKLGVSVGKEAQNLLDRTKQELQDWENWQTNKTLRDQLLKEIKKTMPETEEKAPEKSVETKADEVKAEAKKEETKTEKPDTGRFNPDSETPLLTPEEDANDFTLIDQTPEEAKADEKAAEQREAEARERADQHSKRDTPELDFGEKSEEQAKPAPLESFPEDTTKKSPLEVIQTAKYGSPERILAFGDLPNGEGELYGVKYVKNGNMFKIDGNLMSFRAVEKYFRGDITKNPITPAENQPNQNENLGKNPVEDAKLLFAAQPDVRSALLDGNYTQRERDIKLRRMGIPENVRDELFKLAEQEKAKKNEEKPAQPSAPKEKIEDFGEKIEGARKDTAVKTGKRGTTKGGEVVENKVPAWRKKYHVTQQEDGTWSIFEEHEGLFSNYRTVGRGFKTQEEALAAIPAAYISYNFRFYERNGKWSIYRRNKTTRNMPNIKSGFDSEEDAKKWALEHVDELATLRSTKGENDLMVKPDYERTGERRMKRDVTPEDFAKTFGFRGVQFGNWENQQERQQILNDAYEALYDLADLLNIPPRAISLNGELGAAFGARGHGGSARAHYEPNQVVINLTKPKGAGTFAHEWFHALDNYFEKQSGNRALLGKPYLSEDTLQGKLREELFKKFEVLKEAILDNERPLTEEEIAARKERIAEERKAVEEAFAKLRENLSDVQNKFNVSKRAKNATEEQLKQFDDLVKQIVSDDAPPVTWMAVDSKSRYGTYRYTNDLFEKLNELCRKVVGYSGFSSKSYNSGYLGEIATRMANITKQTERLNQPFRGRTQYYQNALDLDANRSDGYWSRYVEMFARAFSSFIEDKLESEGRKSEYLSYGSENSLYKWDVKPFPEGEERMKINKAFQDFFDTMRYEEDEKGNVRLYKLKETNEHPMREDVIAFEKAIEAYKTKTLNPRVSVPVTSHTPNILLRLDLSDKNMKVFDRKITMPYGVIDKAIGVKESTANKNYHALDLETLKQLPENIYNPVMVLDSNTENSLEIYTQLFDRNGNPVLVALQLDAKESIPGKRANEYVVNSIRSVYGKENANTPVNRLLSGHGRYIHLKRFESWSRAAGVQFPGAGAINSLPHTIIEGSENASENSEKSGRKLKLKEDLGDSRINWNNQDGMGAMPDNANIDYRGFQIELTAKEFRNLTPKGRTTSDLSKIKDAIRSGKGVASPTIFADWNDEKKQWEITGHEGRSRTDAIMELYGNNTLVPVHVIPYHMRARDITEEMLNAPFVEQDIAKYDWAPKYEFNGRNRKLNAPDRRKYSLKNIYTGSAADYDQPSLQFVGTGEGAQVFGYGLYGSSDEDVARWYAKEDANRKSREDVLWDGKPGKTFLREVRDRWNFEAVHELLKETHGDVDSAISKLQDSIELAKKFNQEESIRNLSRRIEILNEFRDRVKYRPKTDDVTGKRNLYKQTFWPDKQEDLLDWDNFVSEGQAEKVAKGILEQVNPKNVPYIVFRISGMAGHSPMNPLYDLSVSTDPVADDGSQRLFLTRGDSDGHSVTISSDGTILRNAWNDSLTGQPLSELVGESAAKYIMEHRNDDSYQTFVYHPSEQDAVDAMAPEIAAMTGGELYEELEDIFSTPKKASEFLYKAGVDGVTYIGNSSGARNYVAFSDKDIRVDEHRKFHIPEKQRQQVNPIREEGEMKESYQDQLNNYTYTVRGQRIVNNDAGRMIAGFGGINGTIKAILNGDFKPMSDTAQRAMQVIINSDEAQKLSEEDGKKLADVWSKYMESGSALGQALAARRIGAFDYTNMDSIRAHINAFLLKMGKAKAQTLRDDVLKKTGIDIDELPEDIVTNPRKLDEVLRVMLSDRASLGDKFYEYWINSILSSPTTHVANTLGNVANAAYELGVKRIAEAMIGSVARALGKNVKNAATFGEYKQMMNAIDWKDAWRRARFMFDVETLDTNSRFDMAHAAIGGKIGRAVRVPGRLLRAADEFAKAVVVPVEAAAYAYREGAGKGYSGKVLQNYIEDQLQDENSDANAWGKQRSLELTFQERGKPGSAVNYLIQLKESGGVAGNIMKYVLPFIKTPHNILRQGIRKSPLGAANLLWQTYKGIRGKRAFDAEYVSLAAEQLLAWGVVMALAGSGDDDEPFITGSSPNYGSAEQRFKANKLPPYSIKIGDNYYSYQRIEPLATGLAFIADGIEAYKAAKRGEDGQKIIGSLLAKTTRMVSDKSFLEGIGKIQKFVENPDRSLKKEMTDFFASWSPNAVRHTINMFDDNVRDNKARDRGMNWFEDQFYVTMNAAGYIKASPKYDYFGRPVKKDSLADSGPMWQMMRLVPIKSVSPDDNMNRAEKLMWKYNMTHPGEEYYPDVPAYYFQRDGKKLYTTGKYWDEFAQKSGQLALKQINNAFKHGLLNERKPTEKDIDLIKKIFQRARKEVRDEMYEKKHYQK